MNKNQKNSDKNRVNKCIVITGMSGGGKSSALKILEDQGFFAIDNLPPMLLPQLIDMLSTHTAAVKRGIAAVVDTRSELLLAELISSVEEMRKNGVETQLLFLDASDSILLKRFGLTRRKHPMGVSVSVLDGITKERSILKSIRSKADVILDSSGFTENELRAALLKAMQITPGELAILLSSFGFKHGIPIDADYVFDVRFLPNPYYIKELHFLSGCDAPVQNYLLDMEVTQKYLEVTKELLLTVLPLYLNTGKQQIHIAIGCTGGRHRSVAMVETLAEFLGTQGRIVVLNHRDMDKEFSI